jgi:glycosyltransferase involved in cell wall biosynthesis/ribosomal protein S18 acetylase RimI-like enzyme
MTRPRVLVGHVATVDLTLRFLLMPQLRRLRDEGYEVVGISAPGPWVSDLEVEGIRHVAWPSATRSWDPRSDLRAYQELVQIFRREKFRIVHTHNPKPGVLGRIAARRAKVPIVVNTVHGLYATPHDPFSKRAAVLTLERIAASFSDLELYQSAEDLEWARRRRVVPHSKSRFLGNGTDLSFFDRSVVPRTTITNMRRELGIMEGEVVVGTVGRLVVEKGYGELFLAARAIREELPWVRFLVLGDRDVHKLDALSSTQIDEARDHIIFTGWRKDVRDLLALMDVFVLPSWREGVPRSAIEAAAMGLPLVVTDIRGCREVVRDGVEGFLVPRRDPRRLTEAVRRLVVDRDLRDRMGRAARRGAEERFDERRVAETVVDAYRRLLTTKGIAHQPSRQPVQIRPATRADAGQIARLHRQALPDSFLPQLGDRFLRTMYRALVGDPQGVTLVAEGAQGMVGFAGGTASVDAFYRSFRRRYGVAAGIAAAPRMLRSDIRRRLRETASYPDRTANLPAAEILAIAVDGNHASQGIGTALAQDLLAGLSARGADEVRVTAAATNATATRFYERLGFRRVATFAVHEGVASSVWVIRCHSSSGSSSLQS